MAILFVFFFPSLPHLISFEFRMEHVWWQIVHRLRHFHRAHLYDNKSTIWTIPIWYVLCNKLFGHRCWSKYRTNGWRLVRCRCKYFVTIIFITSISLFPVAHLVFDRYTKIGCVIRFFSIFFSNSLSFLLPLSMCWRKYVLSMHISHPWCYFRMVHFWHRRLQFRWWCLPDLVLLYVIYPHIWNGAVIYRLCVMGLKDLLVLFTVKIGKHSIVKKHFIVTTSK